MKIRSAARPAVSAASLVCGGVSITVRITPFASAAFSTLASCVGWVDLTISVSSSRSSPHRASEGEAVECAVSLSAASDEAVTVDYTTSDGTAESGTNYTAALWTLTFAAGTTETVRVETAGDSEDEDDETFTRLSNPSGATLEDAETTGTIEDDDEPAALTVASFENMPAGHDGKKLFASRSCSARSSTACD